MDLEKDVDLELLVVNVAWRDDGTAVLTLTGELDVSTAPRLRSHITETAKQADGDIRLDVARLRFCDAAGLAVITSAAEELAQSGRHLRIDHPSPQLLRVLDITELRHLAS